MIWGHPHFRKAPKKSFGLIFVPPTSDCPDPRRPRSHQAVGHRPFKQLPKFDRFELRKIQAGNGDDSISLPFGSYWNTYSKVGPKKTSLERWPQFIEFLRFWSPKRNWRTVPMSCDPTW